MDVRIFELEFKGPTHFGETGIDLENVTERVSSDTLFSALANVVHAYCGSQAATDLVERFTSAKQPPFVISSLFLFAGQTHFLPRPLLDTGVTDQLRQSWGKSIKSLKWLDPDGFIKWTSQDKVTEADLDALAELQRQYADAFILDVRPRVSLDRNTRNSGIYHSGYLHFRKQAGLYGLVAFYDDSFVSQFEQFLGLLGETGLGGERAYGCGTFRVRRFDPVDEKFRRVLDAAAGPYVLLSLYHPGDAEQPRLAGNLLAYGLVKSRGWISSGRAALQFKRRSLGFVTEGSVSDIPLKGQLVDVTPADVTSWGLRHRVYRYGYAFTAPLPGATA